MPGERVNDVSAIRDSLIDPAVVGQTTKTVRWTIATDSSPFEAEVDPHFPSTRVLFMQMAAVIVDLAKIRERTGPFADPVAIREAQKADVIAGALPSSNLMRTDGTPPRRAFREEIANLFMASKVEGRSLLDVLLEVEAEREDVNTPAGTLVMHRCPNPECNAILDDTKKGSFVPVGLGRVLLPSLGRASHGDRRSARARGLQGARHQPRGVWPRSVGRRAADPSHCSVTFSSAARRRWGRWLSSPTDHSRSLAKSRRSSAPCCDACSDWQASRPRVTSGCR